jgi:Fe-S oxidoreductase
MTFHDPCYLGRHNEIYQPPREILEATGVELTEMPRNKERSFCCGAGGGRMWMEEKIGTRININRVEEAIATGATQLAVACPFCRVMTSDGMNAKESAVEVLDVAQVLLRSVKES